MIGMPSAFALGIFSGTIIFIERKPENLRIFRLSLFTGENWTANGSAGESRLALSVSSLHSLPPLPKGEALA